MLNSIFAISLGASLGALLRWTLGLTLKGLMSVIPIPAGTLAANLIGGYLIGLAFALFADNPGLAPEWRLFVVTGFLGGLTTFSSFSVEVTEMLQQGRLHWALTTIGLHVGGSLLMTTLGFATITWLKRA